MSYTIAKTMQNRLVHSSYSHQLFLVAVMLVVVVPVNLSHVLVFQLDDVALVMMFLD